MTLGIFTTLTDPRRRGDCWIPALQCYSELADKVVIINGGTEKFLELPENVNVVNHAWPDRFSWEFIGQQFQRGYEELDTDWVIHADIDFLFKETDFSLIKRVFEDNNQEPALSFWKYQFIQPDRYNLKSRLVIAVNKRVYGDRIRFDSGGDLCQPSLDGSELHPDTVKEARIPFYCYEKITKTYEQVFDDTRRMADAWQQYFGNTKLGEDAEEAFNEWANMVKGRNTKAGKVPITFHPQFIIDTIAMLNPDQFGYNGFGMFDVNEYKKGNLC